MLAAAVQAGAVNALLDVLGMVLLCRVAKTRTTFGHPERAEVTVVIDHIAGVGAFAETEVMATDPAAATALLAEVEEQLGLTGCPVVSLPYRDLVLQRGKVQAGGEPPHLREGLPGMPPGSPSPSWDQERVS